MSPTTLFYWVIVPTIKIALVLALLPLAVAFFTWAERKIIGAIQVRIGPKRVGPHGLLQPIADVLKLLLKEDITPAKANRAVFVLAPMLAIVPAFLTVSVLPFGPEVKGWADNSLFAPLVWLARALGVPEGDLAEPIPLAITDLDIGLLFLIAVSSLGVFSLLLAGWSSNSKYPLLGGLRSAAQLISYEVPLGFALVAGLMMTRTLSMNGIIESQRDLGWSLMWLQPISLFLYFVSGVAETNRVPFDLPEAENELVAGFHTEYSGMKFAFFFLAEYINMVVVSAIAVTMFLGGWLPPLHGLLTHPVEVVRGGVSVTIREPHGWAAWAFSPPLGFLWMVLKIGVLYYLYFWLRATLPRYRYDQLMALGWKWLIPLAMANVGLVGVNVVLQDRLFPASNLPLIPFAVLNLLVVLAGVHIGLTLKRRSSRERTEPAHGSAV